MERAGHSLFAWLYVMSFPDVCDYSGRTEMRWVGEGIEFPSEKRCSGV